MVSAEPDGTQYSFTQRVIAYAAKTYGDIGDTSRFERAASGTEGAGGISERDRTPRNLWNH